MPATTRYASLFQKPQELHQFLLACQQTAIDKNCPQVVSLSLEIPPINPLAVLQAINKPNQPHFYFEKGCQTSPMVFERPVAIAASHVTLALRVEGPQRFKQAKDFIQSCLARTITAGELNLPFAGPHFFCSFTFFDQSLAGDAAFPAATVFLPRWQLARSKNSSVAVVNLQVKPNSNLETACEDLWQDLQAISSFQENGFEISGPNNTNYTQTNVANTDEFKTAVLSALKSIQAGNLHKLVLAHAVDVRSTIPFNLFRSLNNLCQRHPDCYIFSTSNGKGQNFIGASPERLLSMRDYQLATDALAGSAPRGRTAAEDAYFAHSLLCSEKEMREHRAVTDFITQCLSRFGLTPQLPPLPYLLQLSNIQHLQTPIQARVPASLHLLELLAALHPTPAVAGTPRDLAEAQIRSYETFERSLYAGPIGWVDHRGNGEFAVGIRSALLDGCHARLYAGAGIVAGSDPDRELAEIKLKLQTLLEALV